MHHCAKCHGDVPKCYGDTDCDFWDFQDGRRSWIFRTFEF